MLKEFEKSQKRSQELEQTIEREERERRELEEKRRQAEEDYLRAQQDVNLEKEERERIVSTSALNSLMLLFCQLGCGSSTFPV